MSALKDYDSSEIRFDIVKEGRLSLSDSNEIICIDIDKVGDGYRAIVNGCEFSLPAWVGNMSDARQIALEVAAGCVNKALQELNR